MVGCGCCGDQDYVLWSLLCLAGPCGSGGGAAVTFLIDILGLLSLGVWMYCLLLGFALPCFASFIVGFFPLRWIWSPTSQYIVAELLGTYTFVFVGCGSALAHRDNPLTIGATAVVWGLDLVMVKYTLGHVSGAYINPSANIAFAVAQRFPWKHVPSYIMAQLIGATLACLNLRLLFHHQPDIKPALTHYSSSTTTLQAVAWEGIITFILCLTASAVATDHRGYKKLFGVATGAAVAFNVLIAGEITGASMNPARSIGPAIVSGVYKDLWIYVVGPTIGATAATLTYNFLRVPEPEK